MKALLSKAALWIKKRPESLLLLYWPLHTLVYFILNKLTVLMDYHVIHSPLDDMIPFCEWFVIPYELWFFYIAATLIFFLLKNKRDYMRTTFMLITGVVISMIICTVYPSVHDLRPLVFEHDNIATDLVKALYETDNPAVIFPSMHVLVSCLLAICICTSESLKKNTPVKIASAMLSLLICAATVFIKQHSILDVFFGLGLVIPIVLVSDLAVFRKPRKDRSRDSQ